jgi:hypothetical protein
MMELLRILLTEIPCASPARQREQTATGVVARPYREDSPLRVKSADAGRFGSGKADNQREIAVGWRKGRRAAKGALALSGHSERQHLAQSGRSYANGISRSITNELKTTQFPTGKEIAKNLVSLSAAGREFAE